MKADTANSSSPAHASIPMNSSADCVFWAAASAEEVLPVEVMLGAWEGVPSLAQEKSANPLRRRPPTAVTAILAGSADAGAPAAAAVLMTDCCTGGGIHSACGSLAQGTAPLTATGDDAVRLWCHVPLYELHN